MSKSQEKNFSRFTLIHTDSKVCAFYILKSRRDEKFLESEKRKSETRFEQFEQDKAEQDRNVCVHKTQHQQQKKPRLSLKMLLIYGISIRIFARLLARLFLS